MNPEQISRHYAARLLIFLIKRMPPELKPWGEAMLAELVAVEGVTAPLFWALGSAWALVKVLGKQQVSDGITARPWAVTMVAAYYAAFSCELMVVLVSQLVTHQIHESWRDAWFPVLFCFVLALLPAVIALGIWMLDSAARYMAMMFALLHAIVNWAWITQPFVYNRLMPGTRIFLDILVILLLACRPVRSAFKSEKNELSFKT